MKKKNPRFLLYLQGNLKIFGGIDKKNTYGSQRGKTAQEYYQYEEDVSIFSFSKAVIFYRNLEIFRGIVSPPLLLQTFA